jgi:hypothetical protein
MKTASWIGFEFEIWPMYVPWSDVGGIYIFAQADEHKGWKPLYVGITRNFRKRCRNHERWLDAFVLGATHIHVRKEEQPRMRAIFERVLIAAYKVPLNKHHRFLG